MVDWKKIRDEDKALIDRCGEMEFEKCSARDGKCSSPNSPSTWRKRMAERVSWVEIWVDMPESEEWIEYHDTKYLRVDTCTPNEECVSKAELEKLIGRWLDGLELCSDTPLVEVHRKERAALIKELREVMDK